MTGPDLAERIGVSKGQLSKMERNKVAVSPTDQHRLASTFAVSTAWLMGAE